MSVSGDMTALILPWFPIVLSAAIGARLVDRTRASWLGVACALYYVVLVQMSTGVPIWADAATGAALLAGAAAILGIAEWSGRAGSMACSGEPQGSAPSNDEPHGSTPLGVAMEAFDDWLETNRSGTDPWAAFGEFLRAQLHTHCGAAHVRPYRILSEGDAMVPVHGINEEEAERVASARHGVVGYVATTGRSYFAGDSAQDKLLSALAERSDSQSQWCFAIRQGSRTIGIVSVGQLDAPQSRRLNDPDARHAWELLIAHFWITLNEVCRGRSAVTTDAISKLMTRDTFLEEAQRAAAMSHKHGEPVALCVVAIEGLRALLDRGRWEQSNELVFEVARAIREHVRPDDLLGTFDDDRLMVMMRCVDSELASLIATQLTTRLERLPIATSLSDAAVGVRCGVAGSGTATPLVMKLVASAVQLCQQARERHVRVQTDLPEPGASRGRLSVGSGAMP